VSQGQPACDVARLAQPIDELGNGGRVELAQREGNDASQLSGGRVEDSKEGGDGRAIAEHAQRMRGGKTDPLGGIGEQAGQLRNEAPEARLGRRAHGRFARHRIGVSEHSRDIRLHRGSTDCS
jgi:hypothetical protein